MCRWAACLGEPFFLSDIIANPVHCLIDQSRNAEECKTNLNADGLGLLGMVTDPNQGYTAMFIQLGPIPTCGRCLNR